MNEFHLLKTMRILVKTEPSCKCPKRWHFSGNFEIREKEIRNIVEAITENPNIEDYKFLRTKKSISVYIKNCLFPQIYYISEPIYWYLKRPNNHLDLKFNKELKIF